MNIKDLSIKVKLIIFIFVILSIVSLQEVTLNLIVLMLINIITIFLCGIINKKYKYSAKTIEIISGVAIALYYIPLAIVLVSINVIESLLGKIKSNICIAFISFLPLIIVKGYDLSSHVVLIISIVLYFFISYYNKDKEIIDLEEESESKRREIYKLQDKLKNEQEFKEQFLHTAQLEERNKISGNLHDKIGHTISGTLLQLEAIKLSKESSPEVADKLLDLAINNLRVGMDDIRMELREIRPIQEELGINRIRLILEEKTKNTKFKFVVRYEGDLERITTACWMVFVQATKELTTNIIKYSTGNSIEVNLMILNKLIKFEVRDDGQGSADIKKGIGLTSLEEKVVELEGKLIIDGEQGFSVIMLMPHK